MTVNICCVCLRLFIIHWVTCVNCVSSVDTETEVLAAVRSEMCSAGLLVQRSRCEPEVAVKRKVAPSSFLSTDSDLQAAV